MGELSPVTIDTVYVPTYTISTFDLNMKQTKLGNGWTFTHGPSFTRLWYVIMGAAVIFIIHVSASAQQRMHIFAY